MCDQHRLRPACAYAQSDQSLCLSLENPLSVKLLIERHLEFLSLKGCCTGSSEYTLVKMPHCWKSRVTAHICFQALWHHCKGTRMKEKVICNVNYSYPLIFRLPIRRMAKNGFAPPPLGNFADISYLVEN